MKKIVYCIAIIMLLALTACSNTQQLHECPNCNENISENVKFCPNCGTNLSEIGKSNDSSDNDFAAIVDELDEASNTDAPPAIADEGTTQTDDEKTPKPIDWSELENTYQKITRQNMLDRVCPKDTFVLVEGVISNITEKTFDLWIPHNNSYWKDEGYKYDIELGDIAEGCTVEVYIATWSDGSLKKSDGITAIRKLDVEPIVDIVKTYKQTLPDFDYEKIMRNPDKAYGTVWKVMGDVIQVVETKSYLQEFLFETNDWDIIYVSYHKTEDEDNILEGDRLTLYGTFYMTKTYQTVLGSSNTVPILVADCYDMGFVYHEDVETNNPPINNNVGDIDLSEGVIVVSPTGDTVVSNDISSLDTPSFIGSTCLSIDIYNDGMPASNVTNFVGSDTVVVAGRLIGVTGENTITIRWTFPDGTTYDDKNYYMKDGDTTNIGLSAEYIGSGTGSVSIILDSTGVVLATYYYTITGAPFYG